VYDIKDIPEHLKEFFEPVPQVGLESTPEEYINKLVEIFHDVKRVLRDDGVLWLNIGDSYAGSGKGPTGHNGLQNAEARQGFDKQDSNRGSLKYNPLGGVVPSGTKPKDLIGIPWLLAFALRAPHLKCNGCGHVAHQNLWGKFPNGRLICPSCELSKGHTVAENGWYLRADLPWIKRNSMPSSVRDRPASSIEHVFLLAKSQKYYYDYIATMQPSSESYNKDKRPRGVIRQCVNPNGKYPDEGQFKKQDALGKQTYTGFNDRYEDPGTGLRFMRDSDFFFRTWQGLLHNEEGEPMALVVNPRGYKGAHFACFPVQLVEPMILAGTSEKGVCPECGAPWVRDIKKTSTTDHTGETDCAYETGSAANRLALLRQKAREEGKEYTTVVETTGWHPTCSHNLDPVPATVLDPFAGSCATGVACEWHNRDFIGIELKHEYCELGRKRMMENK